MKSPKVIIHTDGSCSGTNGGWAATLQYGYEVVNIAGSEVKTTNNRMELQAVIKALELLTAKCNVELYSDSKYVIDGMRFRLRTWTNNGWKTYDGKSVKNQDLWKELLRLMKNHRIKTFWVKAHNGDIPNEIVDSLAQHIRQYA